MGGRSMKKYGFILMAFAIAALSSCQKEANNKAVEDVQSAKRSFEVTVEHTKTAINGGASVVKWAAGDKIDVYGYTNGEEVGKASFTISDGVGSTVATFTIDDGQSLGDFDEYYAVYPSGKAIKPASLNGSLEISSGINGWDAQAAVEGSYDPSFALMTAVANGEGKLVFRHGTAYYRIKIPDDNITAVKISFANTVMQKRPVYNSASGAITGANSGTKEIGITGALVKDSYYYICAIPKSDGTAMGAMTVTYTHNSVQKSLSTNSWKSEEPEIGYLYDLGCPPLPVVNPSISASNVSIESDDTAGSIAYTVNDGVPGGAISAEITSQTPASWLTLGADSGTAIAFTCAANTTADSKTATVRITYTYDTDKTVYKDVTVTQKGAGVSDSHVRVFYANSSKTAVELLDGVSVSPLEYFTTGGSGADLGGDYSISSWTIGDYTSTKGWKLNSSGYVSFTTSATLNTTVRFYFVRRKTGDTTAQIQLLPDGGDAQVFDTPYDSIGDSGVIALAKNTGYTIKQKSKEQALLLVIVNETE